MKTIMAVLIDRANYGRLLPLLEAIDETDDLQLDIVLGGSMVLDRFGHTGDEVARVFPDHIAERIVSNVEGNRPADMARTVGLTALEFAGVYERVNPDFVLIIGDRQEALGAAIAAAYSNRCIIHVQGGEVSGSIDESARHAITKLAHYHVPATEWARDNLVRMGEHPDTILAVGCPGVDLARQVQPGGRTANMVIAYHPNTQHTETAAAEVTAILDVASLWQLFTVIMWPNIDAGSDAISKAIRQRAAEDWLSPRKNMPPELYLEMIAEAGVCVGNSSSFVRDAGYFGTPVVLVGDRQAGRETAANVHRCKPVANEIDKTIQRAIDGGPYPSSHLYGDGEVCPRIVAAIRDAEVYHEKRLAYPQPSAWTFDASMLDRFRKLQTG
jgi:UDP-hydrolysing UDP-N-acetyl-D-glucosamine 2-epimerase